MTYINLPAPIDTPSEGATLGFLAAVLAMTVTACAGVIWGAVTIVKWVWGA